MCSNERKQKAPSRRQALEKASQTQEGAEQGVRKRIEEIYWQETLQDT